MVDIEESSKESWFRMDLIMTIFTEEQERISNEMEQITQKKKMNKNDIKKLEDLMVELTKLGKEFRADMERIKKEERERLR